MQAFKKERDHLENAAAKLMELALQAGAEISEVCGTFGQNTKIVLEKQDYHMASVDDGYQLGVRVIQGEKQGFASCNSTDPKELKEVASKAVQIAGFSPHNPYCAILPSENIPNEAPSNLWDDSLHKTSLQTQKDWTKLMVEEATRDSRFRLNDGTVSISSGIFLIINSHGTHKLERETVASWSLMGMAVDGDNITSFDHFQEMSRKAQQIPERILASTKKFRDEVVSQLKTGPAQTYKGLVVFTPRAAIDILLSALAHHLNGRNVVEKTARWKTTDFGKQLFSPAITLKDLPWLTDRAGCSVFDREGVPTRNQVLIEKGVLRGFLLDSYAAKALGTKSTGNAAGSPASVPTVGSHTLCLSGGSEPWSAVLKKVLSHRQELLVIQRYSGQVDPVTGDFSGVAKGGEWWRGGERAYTVKETLISGNVFDAFGSALFDVSKETEVIEAGEESPTFVVDNISVTAG